MSNNSKVLKFHKGDVGEMTKDEFILYYNNEWFPFMKEVADYGKSLDTLREMMGLK